MQRASPGGQHADGVIQAATTNGNDMAEADIAAVDALLRALEGTNKPFIYTSGCWVLGNTGDTIADVEFPTDPPGLVAWRPALEQRILAAAERGVRSIVIRPAVVYGRGGGIPAVLINLARKLGVAHYIGTGENQAPMVHVEDLADAYARARQSPGRLPIQRAGESTICSKEVAQAISQAAGLGGQTASWSLGAARKFLGPLADALDLQFSGAKAQRLLGWTPRAPSVIDDLLHGSYQAEIPSSL